MVGEGGDTGLNAKDGWGVAVLTSPVELGFPVMSSAEVFLLAADFRGSLNAEGGWLGVISLLGDSSSKVGLSVSDASWLGASFESDDTYFID